MRKNLLFLIVLSLSITTINAQNQIGINLTINNTFFHKANSDYDKSYYHTESKRGIGFSAPVIIKTSGSTSIKTGLGFQNKKYHFEQSKFDFPNVVDEGSSFYFEIKFTTIEIPVLFCYSSNNPKNKYRLEYKIGCVFSYNMPKANTIGADDIKYYGNDTIFMNYGVPLNWKKTFSPDIYIGISLLKNKNSLRHNELTLSYQYGLLSTAKYEFNTSLTNSHFSKNYLAIVEPSLSYLALSYSFYPKWRRSIKE